jgi:hypothetical protein
VFVYEEVNVIDLYVHVGIVIRLHMNLVLRQLLKIVSKTEGAIGGVSCGQFGTVRLEFKLSTYIQETVGDR